MNHTYRQVFNAVRQKRLHLKCFFCLVLLSISFHAAWAQEIPREFRSARYLGMGDAGVSLAAGGDAFFYNPAGIANVKGIFNEFVLASPQVSVSSHAGALYRDLAGEANIAEIINKVSNVPQHASVANFTGVLFRRAAIGTMQGAEANAFVGTDPDTGVLTGKISVVGRVAFYGAIAQTLGNDLLHVGVSAKLMNKVESYLKENVLTLQQTFQNTQANSFLKDKVRKGMGLGLDAGFLLKLPYGNEPRFGIMLRNIGDLTYKPLQADEKAPDTEKFSVDAGFSLSSKSKMSRVTLAADIHDVFNQGKNIIYKRLHLGAGISFQDFVGFSLGINQGYPTYSAFLNIKLVRIEGGVYSEELEKYPGDLRSQRVFGRISMGWVQ